MGKDIVLERYFTIMVGTKKILGVLNGLNGLVNLSLQVDIEGEFAHPATSIGSIGLLHKYIRAAISETEDVNPSIYHLLIYVKICSLYERPLMKLYIL